MTLDTNYKIIKFENNFGINFEELNGGGECYYRFDDVNHYETFRVHGNAVEIRGGLIDLEEIDQPYTFLSKFTFRKAKKIAKTFFPTSSFILNNRKYKNNDLLFSQTVEDGEHLVHIFFYSGGIVSFESNSDAYFFKNCAFDDFHFDIDKNVLSETINEIETLLENDSEIVCVKNVDIALNLCRFMKGQVLTIEKIGEFTLFHLYKSVSTIIVKEGSDFAFIHNPFLTGYTYGYECDTFIK